MNKHPDWATKHRAKGTELRLIRGKYYLYEVSSKWNSKLKRPQKITGKYLGRISEEFGFVKKKTSKKDIDISLSKTKIVVKESGVSQLFQNTFDDYIALLKKHFPDCWQTIIALSYGRLVHHNEGR